MKFLRLPHSKPRDVRMTHQHFLWRALKIHSLTTNPWDAWIAAFCKSLGDPIISWFHQSNPREMHPNQRRNTPKPREICPSSIWVAKGFLLAKIWQGSVLGALKHDSMVLGHPKKLTLTPKKRKNTPRKARIYLSAMSKEHTRHFWPG